MAKHIWFVPSLALCLSCGGGTPQVEEPSTPSTEEPSATPPNEETPSESPEEDSSSEPPPASEEVKKKCEELDKSTCKVTIGCGWNDVKKCVDTTLSE